MPDANPYASPLNPAERPIRAAHKPWLLGSFLLAGGGLLVAFAALVYGVILVGVPSPDATPEIASREAFHSSVSGWGMLIGGVIFVVGSVTFLLVAMIRIAKLGTYEAARDVQ